MTVTLLASNEFGALVGNDDGHAAFYSAKHLIEAGDSVSFTMPKVMGRHAFGLILALAYKEGIYAN